MTDDLPEREDDLLLAAEYTLGLLTAREVQAFEDRLAVDPRFREDYRLWAEDFAQLTDPIAPVAPPASVLKRVQDQLWPQEKRSLLRRLGIVPALIGAFVAASLVVIVTNLGLLTTTPDATPTYAAQVAAEDGSLVVLAAFTPETGQLRVERTAGAAPPGRVLELWVIAGDNPPASLGVLPDAATADLAIPADLVAAVEGGLLAISDEPPGGSPTGAPTGAVLATGPVTEL